MVRINLLDWRAERREKRRKKFFGMLVLSALGGLIVVLGGLAFLSGQVDHQKQRNTLLTQEIANLDKQIAEIQELEKVKANLLARMQVIEKLQASRTAMVHFFDEVVNTLPEGVFLTSLKQTGDDVAIDGIAESNGRISSYMKNLESSKWFADPALVVIKTVEREHRRQSEFSLKVKNLTTAKLEGAAAAEEDKGGHRGGVR